MFFDSPVTLYLLVINGLLGVYTLLIDPTALDKWAFKPYAATQRGEWWRFLTAGFTHVNFLHLLFNMVALFSFGPVVEGYLGSVRFLIVYLGADLTANLATWLRFRHQPSYSAAGASGSISGIVFAYCLFAPFSLIGVFFVPMPAIVFAVLYVALSIYASRQNMGGIAHEAHLGGAAGGVLLTILLYPTALLIFLSQIGLR